MKTSRLMIHNINNKAMDISSQKGKESMLPQLNRYMSARSASLAPNEVNQRKSNELNILQIIGKSTLINIAAEYMLR